MATPKITNLDNVNKTYMADGVQYALDPSTNRFAIASTIKPVPNATIQNASPITIPPINTATLPAQLPQTQDFINAQSENKTVEQNLTQNNLDLQKLQNELANKSADQLALEQAQGIPQISQKVLDLQALADQKALEYNLTPYSLAGQGRGITTGILRGQEAVKQRQLAVEYLFADAQLNAQQNKQKLAQSQVDRALSLKYDPILAKIDAQKQIIENTKFMLTRSDLKLADAKQAELDRQKQEITDKKELEKGINAVALEVAKNGGDPNLIKDAKTIGEAINLAGASLRSDNTEVIKLGDNQAYLIDKTTGKIIKSFGDGSGGSIPGDRTAPLYNGMDSKTATAVRSKVSNFKTEPMVQNFAVIQDGYNFASSLNTKTTNPADDQALIYSLAKALDPGSVVREGEYATAQKYAQSWVKSFGKGVEQAISGTGFLSEDARKNIKKTIEQRYESSRKSYDNLYNQYAEGVNSLTGKNNGKDFLVDYAIQKPSGLPKGTMDDRTFVEKALSSQNIDYVKAVNSTPPGQIPVLLNSTGEQGYIPVEEYDASLYTKL